MADLNAAILILPIDNKRPLFIMKLAKMNVQYKEM